MYEKLILFLDEDNVLSASQHGFRRGYSTETAIADFVQYINDKLDQNEYVISVFFVSSGR